MVEIDPSGFEALLAQARANLAAAQADQRSATADLELTRATTAADLALGRPGVEAAQQLILRAQADAAKAEAERAKLNLPGSRTSSVQFSAATRSGADGGAIDRGRVRAALKAITTAQAQLGEAQARLLQAR